MVAIGEGPETKALLDFARPMFALYIGGMGAKGKNFYNDARLRLRLREGGEPRSRTSTSSARRTRPRRSSPTSGSRRPTSSAPRRTSRSASPPSRSPASPTCRSSRLATTRPRPCASSRSGWAEAAQPPRTSLSRCPTPQQVRRALARAERGAALDVGRGRGAARGARRGPGAADVRGRAGARRRAGRRRSRRRRSPTPPRCSSRSPGCAATGATTAPSSRRPAQAAREGREAFLSPDEILEIARQGAELGCTEALFTLGDRPEDRWPEAQEWLDEAGLRLDAGLRAGDGDPGARGDRPAAAPQPRRHVVGGDEPAQAGLALDGDDAGDDLAPALRGRRARPTSARPTRTPTYACGCSRTPAGSRSRSPPAC